MSAASKTWGPFTGRQLTTIACVALVMFMLPVGAYALTVSNVAITDPGGRNRAAVGADGALRVGDGTGPITVDGTVSSRTVLPTLPIVVGPEFVPEGTAGRVMYGPSDTTFGISSVTLANQCASRQVVTLVSQSGRFERQVSAVPVAANGHVHLTYPVPLAFLLFVGQPASFAVRTAGPSGCILASAVGLLR